jgi:hypothetical protein
MEICEKENGARVESVLRSFCQKQKAENLIDHILGHLEFQDKPVLTADMKAKSHTGGRAELEKESAQHREALKVPKGLIDGLTRELRRTRARLEWGWGFGFSPDPKDVGYLESKDYKYVLFGLHKINEDFIAVDCPSPPREDDLFRLFE